MKIKYTTNTGKRKKRKYDKLLADRNLVALWHRKFAWRPLKITTPKDSENHSTVVWFEWVMQKAHIENYEYRLIRIFVWTRHTEKEYFMKKLNGTLEPEQHFDIGSQGVDSN